MKRISGHFKVVVVFFLAIFLLMGTTVALCGDTVLLVTEEEASQPGIRARPEELDDGPVISIVSPENGATLSGPFRLHVEVARKEGGSDVSMNSLKVRYHKAVAIDITDRVQEYISGTNLDIPNAEFPDGKHTTEIYIEDADGNASRKYFEVKVITAQEE
jgi:hypothetical protein